MLGERLFRVAAFRLKAASQQTLANPHLQRGGAQQITAAHDIINTHIEVIHDHDQLIAEQSIGSANHGIAYLAGQIVVLWTIDTVVKACDTINDSGIALLFRRHGSRQRSGIVRHCTLLFSRCRFRHGDTDGMLVAANQTGTDLVGMVVQQAAARAGVHHEAVALVGGRGGANVGTRAETGVQHTLRAQAFESVFVSFSALGLEHRFAIPVEAEPMQVIHHELVRTGDHTRLVHVLDTHQHAVATRAGRKPCTQHGVHVPDMHAPRRRRRESSSHWPSSYEVQHHGSEKALLLRGEPI